MAQDNLALQSQQCIRLLIAVKEPSVRSELSELCRHVTDLHLLGATESGRAALDAAETLCPNLMVIEVALPDMSGFDVLRAAGGDGRPLGIMISNETDHAARAFMEGAVDYLVKPVSPDRFTHAIGRARQRCLLEGAARNRVAHQTPPAGPPKFLVGERQRRLYPLAIDSIDYIEADGNYVTLRVGESEYISRDSIKRLASELSAFGFLRIERSILLNIGAVRFAEPVGHGLLAFTLSSGVCLYSSKTYREEILRVLPWRWRHSHGGSILRG
ncbi:MAG TPA: LytTR family DNA-binding domain-containing protein [Steroidobacteraceae bacterium]|nr:LytTR family DNA-binding domain-containing protein [Steroidobacteraceae bacterium]